MLFPASYINDHFDAFDSRAITMAVVLCILALLSLIGTIIDLFQKFGEHIKA